MYFLKKLLIVIFIFSSICLADDRAVNETCQDLELSGDVVFSYIIYNECLDKIYTELDQEGLPSIAKEFSFKDQCQMIIPGALNTLHEACDELNQKVHAMQSDHRTKP